MQIEKVLLLKKCNAYADFNQHAHLATPIVLQTVGLSVGLSVSCVTVREYFNVMSVCLEGTLQKWTNYVSG